MSKREDYRKKRQAQSRRERWIVIGAILIAVLFVAALFIFPLLKPIGEIVQAPAYDWQNSDRNALGNPEAPVQVDIYSDFQCPACRSYAENFEPQLIEKYINTGKVYFRYIPFNVIGPESDDAAIAAYCAADQGKFWQYHDILFANQTAENRGDFTDRRLAVMAEKVGLDTGSFNKCYSASTYRKQIILDQQNGEKLGVNSTPSFVVNGVLVDGNQLEETILSILNGG